MNNEVYFSLNDCDLSYGKKKIFEKVSFSLHDNDKIALIGKNGVDEIIELDLNESELVEFNNSVDAVRSMNSTLSSHT